VCDIILHKNDCEFKVIVFSERQRNLIQLVNDAFHVMHIKVAVSLFFMPFGIADGT
jgi:hypothetical protein